MSDTTENPADGAASEGEPQSPEQIRDEIERTQQQLGDTVEALAHKTDVKAQASARIDAAKESIQETVHDARESASETKDELLTKVKQATPESAGAGAHQMSATVQERPLPFAAAAAFAGGVVVGWLIGRR
ncbi:MAG TPA: DUF3618 domain-containing protein [Solirubrobacteraceae bacterium]|jgi:ElaB/YqjD/DUF883 family membrane-anchored ribosome-binding protein|nr:DUF3618 domain-containing protein [Solirubrobacteraceae bacterium]